MLSYFFHYDIINIDNRLSKIYREGSTQIWKEIIKTTTFSMRIPKI